VWSNPFASCFRKVTGLAATIIEMPREVFKSDGQSHTDTFSIDLAAPSEVEAYRLRLALEAIRRHVDNFRFW
jgi:hypothetical protein